MESLMRGRCGCVLRLGGWKGMRCQTRGVRHRYMSPWMFKSPYPFMHRRSGIVQFGPYYKEIWEWPAEEHSEFTPKFKNNNLPMLMDYAGDQPTGYTDASTREYVHVPEMVPEIVVPDLKGFELKPYVSFRADPKLERKEEDHKKAKREYEKLQNQPDAPEKAVEEARGKMASSQWPPPPMTAEILFDIHYRNEITRNYKDGKYSDNT